mmetsp:Transcript_111277/g.321761  ORF Transcript_111277/g.321761 Transcript_111277/m.321761 type:complete len:218 (-) Transcript_111277:236-889(-)
MDGEQPVAGGQLQQQQRVLQVRAKAWRRQPWLGGAEPSTTRGTPGLLADKVAAPCLALQLPRLRLSEHHVRRERWQWWARGQVEDIQRLVRRGHRARPRIRTLVAEDQERVRHDSLARPTGCGGAASKAVGRWRQHPVQERDAGAVATAGDVVWRDAFERAHDPGGAKSRGRDAQREPGAQRPRRAVALRVGGGREARVQVEAEGEQVEGARRGIQR